VRKAVTVGAVVAAVVGVAAAARPAWGLFSGSAGSAQSVQAAALPAPVPSVAGPVWVGGGVQVDALAGSATTPDVVASMNVGSNDSVEMWSPKGLVWTTPVSSLPWTVALDPADGVVVTVSGNVTAVTVLNAQTGALERTVSFPAGYWSAANLAADPVTGTMWIALSGIEGAEVVPLDPETGKFGTPIALPQGDQPVAAAWDAGELVVANGDDGVAFVDTTTGSVTNVALPGQPAGVAASPSGEAAATLPWTNGGEVALLASPTASPDLVPASGVGTGVAWDAAAGEFATSSTNGTLFVGTGGQATQLTWPTFNTTPPGPSLGGGSIAPVAGGVAEGSTVGGVAFVVEGLTEVGAFGGEVAEPPDATCQILAGPSSAGPWAVVGSEACPGGTYPPLTVEVPAGDTWFEVRAAVNNWQSTPTQATQWSVPTAGTSG
jgi:hypothetical protein